MLFISRTISKQRECFSHGYSINQERLKKLKIMIPVDENRNPDYDYMERYGKIFFAEMSISFPCDSEFILF